MTAFGGGKGHRGMDLSCTVRVPGADASNQAQLPLLLLPDEAGQCHSENASSCPEVGSEAVVS